MATDLYEKQLVSQGYNYICGCDESGMGALAGNLWVGAVIFPKDMNYSFLPGLNDSKQKTPAQREVLYELVKKYALDYATEIGTVEEIDRLNVYWARFAAMNRALNKLRIKPDYILMDGNKKIPNINIPQMAIVKGDAKSYTIAAASILCKVERDRYMVELAKLVPEEFGWKDNKAYWCEQHVSAFKKYGKTKWHRQKYIEKLL